MSAIERLIAKLRTTANYTDAKLVSDLVVENARLQSIIDAANAQEPVGYERLLNGEWVKCSKTRYEVTSDPVRALYALQIPTQSHAIISAIGTQQSPAVAVPAIWHDLKTDPSVFDDVERGHKTHEILATMNRVAVVSGYNGMGEPTYTNLSEHESRDIYARIAVAAGDL